LTVSAREIYQAPRSWAELIYRNHIHFNKETTIVGCMRAAVIFGSGFRATFMSLHNRYRRVGADRAR
jgi:hypothetical protein